MNNKRILIPVIAAMGGAFIVIIVFVLGYYLGKSEQLELTERTPSPVQAQPQPVAPVQAPVPAQTPPSGQAQYSHPVTDRPIRQVVKFQVGTGNVKTMLADENKVWVGTSHGVIKYNIKDDSHEVLDNKNTPLLSNGIFYLAKFDGKLWVGTYGGGLHSLEGEEWKSYNIPHGLGDAFIYGILKVPNGDIWIATWSGANRILGGEIDNPDAWQTFTVENTDGGLPNDWVYGIAADKKGNIWLGTEGGIARFDGEKWRNWNHKEGLGAKYEIVKDDILKTQDTASGQSSHHRRQKIEMGLENIDVPFNPNYIVSMLVDDKDRVWLGTWGGGLSILADEKFITYTTKDGLAGNYVSMLYQDPAGKIWVGSNQGLSKTERAADNRLGFTNYTVDDGLYSRHVFSMTMTEDQSIWVGSYGGVAHFVEGL